jgi:hypothetical protein
MFFVNLFARAAGVHHEVAPENKDKTWCCFTYAVEATCDFDAIKIVRENSESEMYRSGWRDFLYSSQTAGLIQLVFVGASDLTGYQVNQHFDFTKLP